MSQGNESEDSAYGDRAEPDACRRERPQGDSVPQERGAHDENKANVRDELREFQARHGAQRGATPLPDKIDKYIVTGLLGEGAFGTVYVAYNPRVGKRKVAIKVQRRARICEPEIAELFRKEAETVSELEHPNIVEVHDAGRLEDGRYFIVSKYIDGTNLAEKLKQQRPSYRASAQLVATIAEALDVAHRKKLIHRDVKPANILIASTGTPYVVDFGLALTEEDFGKQPGRVGTVSYMSPEQARGKGDRVDGRSDMFSLGVVFYELLTGERPFTGNADEVLELIETQEARPPRQLDGAIPKKLAKICLKMLEKDPSKRYETCSDVAQKITKCLKTSKLPEAILRGSPRAEAAEDRRRREATRSVDPHRGTTRCFPRLLPFLANRKEHEEQITRAVEKGMQREPPCPVVGVVPGDEHECHHAFMKRLKEVSLPRLLAMDKNVQSVDDYFIHFPRCIEGFQSQLRSDFLEFLHLPKTASLDDIAHVLAGRVVLIHTQLSTPDWSKDGRRKVVDFLRFWETMPASKSAPLVVCLRVQYCRGNIRFDPLLFAWRNSRIRKYIRQLDFTAYGGLEGVVVTDLQSITRKDADDWAEGEASEFFECGRLLTVIRGLFGERKRIPMEEFAERIAAELIPMMHSGTNPTG